ncbi:MAG: TraB/GumN family protein [Parachlamydiaceae bacterium]|nr:TraB/GumN family protein [Parachlamydiaceae bacterium]
MQINQQPNDYLYFVIEDDNNKVRGHVIGVQHWVEPKDKDFNPRILDAIERSARMILEIPPDSKEPLLPSKVDSKKYKNIISDTLENLKMVSKKEESQEIDTSNIEIEKLLSEIEEECLKSAGKNQDNEQIKSVGYEKVKDILPKISSIEEKLMFLKTIKDKIFDFNLVSIERNINKKVEHKIIEHLEIEDLNKKIFSAKIKLNLRHIKENVSDKDYQNILEQLNQMELQQEKINFLMQQKEEFKIANKGSPLTYQEEQLLNESLYRAWVDGDVENLKTLINRSFEIFKEEPEFQEIHQPRDKQMAERIINVICTAKKENTEAAFMMGCGHLLYTNHDTNRINIIDHLNEHFKTDLKGWSIRQITKNDVVPMK